MRARSNHASAGFAVMPINETLRSAVMGERGRSRAWRRVVAVKKLPAATELNYASSWREILDVVSTRKAELKGAHFAVALSRIGRSLVGSKDVQEREKLKLDGQFDDLLGLVFNPQSTMKPRQLCDSLWACGMLGYTPPGNVLENSLRQLEKSMDELMPGDLTNISWTCDRLGAKNLVPKAVREAVSSLPFEVIPGMLDWMDLNVPELKSEVSLKREIIRLKDKVVEEQRLTAWQHKDGELFRYSGKSMEAMPFTPTIERVGAALLKGCDVDFDGVLINYYENSRAGMRYHSDPDQGLYWTNETAVVSVGDTRQFIFRRIDDHHVRHIFWVSGGDVVLMTRDCQDVYQHCVKVESDESQAGPRMSLVYKKSLSR